MPGSQPITDTFNMNPNFGYIQNPWLEAGAQAEVLGQSINNLVLGLAQQRVEERRHRDDIALRVRDMDARNLLQGRELNIRAADQESSAAYRRSMGKEAEATAGYRDAQTKQLTGSREAADRLADVVRQLSRYNPTAGPTMENSRALIEGDIMAEGYRIAGQDPATMGRLLAGENIPPGNMRINPVTGQIMGTNPDTVVIPQNSVALRQDGTMQMGNVQVGPNSQVFPAQAGAPTISGPTMGPRTSTRSANAQARLEVLRGKVRTAVARAAAGLADEREVDDAFAAFEREAAALDADVNQSQEQPQSSGRTRMTKPDGSKVLVKDSDVAAALKQGYVKD